MARPKTFSDAEVASLLKTMRDGGVLSFKYKGLEVQFIPHFPSDPAFADMERLNKEQAMQRFGEVNKDDDALLEWST